MTNANIARFAADVRTFANDCPGETIELVERAIDAQLRADTGGDGALSNARKLGRATVETTRGRGDAEASAAGARVIWSWLERGTSAHVVEAKGRGRSAVLATPYGPRKRVKVSGMRAKRTWSRGADEGMRNAERDIERRWSQIGR